MGRDRRFFGTPSGNRRAPQTARKRYWRRTHDQPRARHTMEWLKENHELISFYAEKYREFSTQISI